jgi:hypothetical protein
MEAEAAKALPRTNDGGHQTDAAPQKLDRKDRECIQKRIGADPECKEEQFLQLGGDAQKFLHVGINIVGGRSLLTAIYDMKRNEEV